MGFKEILKEAAESLRPTGSERKAAENELKGIMSRLKGLRDAVAKPGGSFAKGTWITGAHDIDVFVCFNYRKYSGKSNELSDALQRYLKSRKIKHERIHGSRDYFDVKRGNYNFELVPILNVTSAQQAMNITDASTLHTEWVKKNIKGKLADEVRLLKAFLAAQRCYGAESYIRGFSGYVCEIIIANYGSFEKAIKSLIKSREKPVIDVKGFYKRKNIFLSMNASKTMSPVIVVDPVNAERNAAASLGPGTFEKFRKAAIKFLKKPSGEFFIEKPMAPGEIKKEEKANIIIEATPVSGKRDVIYAKIAKISEHVSKQLERNGFTVKDSGIEWNQNPLAWFRAKENIEPFVTVKGPPKSTREHAQRFRKMHKKTYEKKGWLYAEDKREFTEAKKFVQKLLKEDEYVKERCKKVTVHD